MGRTSGATRARRRNSELGLREAAINEMKPALRNKVKAMQKAFTDSRTENLMFYYKLGQDCLEIQNNPQKYGDGALKLVEQAFSVQARTLRNSRAFAETYSEEERDELLEMTNSDDGFKLHWGHVRFLLTVPNKEQRESFARQALDGGWDPGELHKRIQKKYGQRRSGGRPHSFPAEVGAGLRQVRDVSKVWLDKYDNGWNGRARSIFANLISTPPDRYTEAMKSDLETIIEQFEGIASRATDSLEIIRRALEHVSTALEADEEVAAEATRSHRQLEFGNGSTTRRARARA